MLNGWRRRLGWKVEVAYGGGVDCKTLTFMGQKATSKTKMRTTVTIKSPFMYSTLIESLTFEGRMLLLGRFIVISFTFLSK